MNPNERRRIVWGPGENANLDPFVVDVFGRVFHGDGLNPLTPLDRVRAAKAWNRHGDGHRLHEVDPSAPNLAGRRLPPLRPDELIRPYSDALLVNPVTGVAEPIAEPVSRWLFVCRQLDDRAVWRTRSEPPPVVMEEEPPDWLRLDGDPDRGWFEVAIESRFVSVFHGPSVAARMFNTGDNSST